MGFLNWWNKNMPGAGAIGGAFQGREPLTPGQAGFTPGMPGYDEAQAELTKMMGQGGPYAQGQQIGAGAYDEDMRNYITGLQNRAAGRGESLAEKQYKSAADQGMQQTASLAASGRGNPGMAGRQAQQANSQITQGLAQGSSTAKLQEMMGANQQLGQALGMADQSNFNRQSANAQLAQQTGAQNQAAFMQMLQTKYGMSSEQAQNFLGYYQAMAQQNAAAMGQPTTGDKMLNIFSTLGGLFGGG